MRNGKIATLPSDIRNELSFRMYQGKPTKTLLAWLNALPLHEKPGASRNHDGAACQSPRPAQRGEGQREGSKTRPNKRCRSISSRPRSKPVKARQSETAGLAGQTPSAKTSRPQTPRSPEEAATSPTGQTDSTAPAIRMENETAKNAKNAGNENPALSVLSAFSAVKSGIRNPQSAIESNPVKPGQSETSSLTREDAPPGEQVQTE